MNTWLWQTWEGSSYLTCSLLNRWPHGFFTRQFYSKTPQELTSVLQSKVRARRVKQVHGNQVVSVREIRDFLAQQSDQIGQEVDWPEADGLVSDGPNQAVWVCSADCTPILIADGRTGQVSAIHAGWRGTAAKILPNAIARMQAQGSTVADLSVAMGPAIAGEVYQVSTEVAGQVGRSILDLENLTLPDPAFMNETVTRALMDLPRPPILADSQAGCVRLDIRRINALQLEEMGLNPRQVAISPHCTYQDPERFFSYRRDSRKQVQWSGIVSNPIH